ncbi:MAG TPA: SDR family NAD(P)-dependent oxidoreductase [Gemmatimonadales bacterium]|nr:SDR family NAD(P)-dependent oxidoreductase [Gemmatimonadales bacterium]
MNRITGKLALITGASSGIGLACARRFAAEGAHLVLWARREARLRELATELVGSHGVTVRTATVDVRDRTAVDRTARALLESGGVPDILLNNAGLAAGLAPVQEGNPDDWERMIDTNVKGLLWVTRALLPAMIARGRGHVVNIGSTAGHQVYPKGNVYNASKYAVRALTEGMNLDVAGTPIRVSAVDPGHVETEFALVRFGGDAERAKGVYQGFRPLSPDDVADAVSYIVNLPEHVNVLDLVLLPAAQRNVYVIDRQDKATVDKSDVRQKRR